MIRRLTTLITLALAIALGVRPAAAGSDTEPPEPVDATAAPVDAGTDVFAGFDTPEATEPPATAGSATAQEPPSEPSGNLPAPSGEPGGMAPEGGSQPAAPPGSTPPIAPAAGSMPEPAAVVEEPPALPLGEGPPLSAGDGFQTTPAPGGLPIPTGAPSVPGSDAAPGLDPQAGGPPTATEPDQTGAPDVMATSIPPATAPTAGAVANGPSPRDEQVNPAQAPVAAPAPAPAAGPEGANLPPAQEPPGGAEVPQNAPAGDPFIVSPDRLREGPNAVGLTVQVNAPQVANLNLESTVQILVKNSGPSEATNVMVRYPMPEGLEFVQSDPPRVRFDGSTQFWQLNTLAPGAERVIRVKVKYHQAGPYDHGVIVTLQGGAKARTQARQPQLKAEVRVDKATVLKDQSVRFDITVSNFGDLPARDVVIQAKLGAGLHHDAGRELVYSLKQEEHLDALAPGQSVTLPLVVRAKAMGKQTCEVSISSPDEPREATAHAEVEVTAPQLQVALDGPTERYPNAPGTYTVTVTNQGTASAKKVVVAIRIPFGGTPKKAEPKGALWKDETRTVYWQVENLPAGESQAFKVRVLMGGVGTLDVKAGARAQGLADSFQTMVTNIMGIPHVRFTVSEPRGVLDVGEETEYQIRLVNDGTAEARDIAVKARFSDHLQVLSVSGADAKAPVAQQPTDGVAILPSVPSLPPGAEVTLGVHVKAIKEGTGSCEVLVSHKDLAPEVGAKTTTVTRITSASGIQRQ